MIRTLALLTLLALAVAPISGRAEAKPDKAAVKAQEKALKKAAKDPYCAENWRAAGKAAQGKKVTTCVTEVGEIGMIASDAAYAVIPVATANKSGEFGGQINVILATAEVEKFAKKISEVKTGKGTSFGAKVIYPEIKGTLAIIDGETALVLMPELPAAATVKPTVTLEAQRAAAPAGEAKPEEPAVKPAEKPSTKGAKKASH